MTVPPHIKGLIFDNDGTLVDTMPMHYRAWVETVEQYGGQFPEQLFYDLGGVPSDTLVEILNEKFGTTMDPDLVAEEKERLFVKKYAPQATLIEPVAAIARAYKGKLPIAVATGGITPVVTVLLEAVGMADFFDAVVAVDDVERGKPAPDTFLEAARRLGVQPELCQVFEDSDSGIQGAKAAGMTVVDVREYL